MNKFLIIVPFFLAVLFSSQVIESEPLQDPAPACKNPGDVNPNGSSELSLLMRKMDAHAARVRKQVLAKKTPGTFPKEFSKIFTATPTDSETKHASFNPFADGYLQALNDLQASTSNNLVSNYNGLVNSCISCHSQHCPGPLSRIKKLLIAEKVKS